MSIMAKLARVLVGPESSPEDVIPRLRAVYTALGQEAHQLARHAEIAPNEQAQTGLSQLAENGKAEADRLRQTILELGGFPGDPGEKAPLPGGVNHWERLVQDLEAHREIVQQLREEATRIDGRPELADLLRSLAHATELNAERIRALIARSDPQALD